MLRKEEEIKGGEETGGGKTIERVAWGIHRVHFPVEVCDFAWTFSSKGVCGGRTSYPRSKDTCGHPLIEITPLCDL